MSFELSYYGKAAADLPYRRLREALIAARRVLAGGSTCVVQIRERGLGNIVTLARRGGGQERKAS